MNRCSGVRARSVWGSVQCVRACAQSGAPRGARCGRCGVCRKGGWCACGGRRAAVPRVAWRVKARVCGRGRQWWWYSVRSSKRHRGRPPRRGGQGGGQAPRSVVARWQGRGWWAGAGGAVGGRAVVARVAALRQAAQVALPACRVRVMGKAARGGGRCAGWNAKVAVGGGQWQNSSTHRPATGNRATEERLLSFFSSQTNNVMKATNQHGA